MAYHYISQVGGVSVSRLCHAHEEAIDREQHTKGLGMNSLNGCNIEERECNAHFFGNIFREMCNLTVNIL